ncbi:MAG TPA: GTPase HflX [Acidimicrobiia bacterium]|nr:GTPase HflX [Acidimicrobiia bacterium]
MSATPRRAARQRRRLTATEVDLAVVRQRALLVGTTVGTGDLETTEASSAELARLADTAGADPAHTELQRRTAPDPATYVGSGKVAELRQMSDALDIDVVIFDDELTPAQQRNLEQQLGRDVVDRVALILDIFAQHATSRAGMIQVELAQLRYHLPRLRGRGHQLSQQAAGIGTRGPGETKLEVDRRRIQRRITQLERDLDRVAGARATQRKARGRGARSAIALVGYTNAGKSTLLNRLSHADVVVEDRLFSTLDPTVRQVRLPGGETVLMSDTVGFIRRLPHQVVEAFRSTLEEVAAADYCVHVVDATNADDAQCQIEAVRTVLAEIGADNVPELLVANQADRADPDELRGVLAANPGAIAVSAVTGEGVPELLETLARRLRALAEIIELAIPYDRGDVLAALHREGEVLVEVHEDRGMRVRARLPAEVVSRYRDLLAG